ncbi:MAG: PBECR2 nuclease fold domain-containing protein [Pontibacterium sp.]
MPDYGTRPFTEAINYFNQKRPLPTTGWEDVYGLQHDHAFMVAGANKMAIVEGLASAVQAAIEKGESLQSFRTRFDDIVHAHGWDYKGSRGWRSRLIYETNIRQAYNAGREAQFADPSFSQRFPYVEYRHSGAENFRPQHKAWDGLILRSNDPWWNTNSPSNGYGCKCKKFARSQRWMDRNGKTAPDIAPDNNFVEHIDKRTGEIKKIPEGIDPGFEHRPGQNWINHTTPTYKATGATQPIPHGPVVLPPLPAAQQVSEQWLMEDGLPDQAYVDAFLSEFGQGQSFIFKDVIGEPLAINQQLFQNRNGELKVSKDKVRHRYMRLLARALIEPDEIWALLEPDASQPNKYRIKRRYIKRWVQQESGQAIHGFSAFEYGQSEGVWQGSTVFTPVKRKGKQRIPARDAYLEAQREGVLLYRKEAE